MRSFYDDLKIDGKPILVPDCDIAIECTDLDDADSGRDETGVMHRIVLREGVKSIQLSYATLTLEDYRYMESLFKGKSEFAVELRDADDEVTQFTAYRAKHGIVVRNVRAGIFKNYKFSLIEC